jgi:protein-S-isoprenylcysteine O-methyltransferase Ste14
MADTADTVNVIVRPPTAWALAVLAGLALNWLMPLPFLPAATHLPTTTIVETGPYRFTRNPIYLGMVLGLIGLAIAFNSLWLLMMLVPFALVIRYGVITREEACLEHRFGDVYRRYCARVPRWLWGLSAKIPGREPVPCRSRYAEWHRRGSTEGI